MTPHLASLASELEGRPFHVIASHNQNGTKDEVLSYARSKGIEDSSKNFTVTKSGRHPHVKGNGYVPYYMVFDHRGKLVRDHMCGDYHGGDGLKFIETVKSALDAAPSIYLGEEPFELLRVEADKIRAKKDLGKVVASLEGMAASDETSPGSREEADRLLEAIQKYMQNQLQTASQLEATSPAEVLPLLSGLSRELAGSQIGETASARYKAAKKDKGIKEAIKAAAGLAKIQGMLADLDACKSCKQSGSRDFRHTCAGCRAEHAGEVAQARSALGKYLKRWPDLPITDTIKGYADELE